MNLSFNSSVKITEQHLMEVARGAIEKSIFIAWDRCLQKGNEPEEPDFLACLVLEGTKMLQNGWEILLQPFGIQVSILGIYCHQTPKVKFNNMHKTSCEIGDILLCHFHKDRRGQIRRNSLLLQAKVTSQQPYYIPNREADQLHLYSYWPEFNYISGPLNNETRNVTPHTIHRGAQYLLIEKKSPDDPLSGLMGLKGTYPIGVCMPDSFLMNHAPYEKELVDFLLCLSGRTIIERNQSKIGNGWSQMIWDLIDLSIGRTFRRNRSGYEKAPRISGDLRMFDGIYTIKEELEPLEMVKAIYSFGNEDIPPFGNFNDFDEEAGAPSLILIRTSEREY